MAQLIKSLTFSKKTLFIYAFERAFAHRHTGACEGGAEGKNPQADFARSAEPDLGLVLLT